MTAFFVTGTDTEVGKTTVSCALLRAARAQGNATRGIKPVESGCQQDPSGLLASDAIALGKAANHPPMVFAKFVAPLAPKAAASDDGVAPMDVGQCVQQTQEHLREFPSNGLALVEGAGGLLVPLVDNLLIVDLAKALELPLLIVGRDGLGTINHTSLTILIAERYGLSVAGFAFSATGSVSPSRATQNAAAITDITGARYLGCLSRLVEPSENDGRQLLKSLQA